MSDFTQYSELQAEAAEIAEEYELKHYPLPSNPAKWIDQARQEVSQLEGDHPQKKLLEAYIRAASRCENSGNEEGLKLHIRLIARNWVHIEDTRYRQAQRKKGGGRWANDETNQRITAIVKGLASSVDALGDQEPPSELWPHLYSAMEDAGLNPRELNAEKGLMEQSIQHNGSEIPYRYETFRKAINRARE